MITEPKQRTLFLTSHLDLWHRENNELRLTEIANDILAVIDEFDDEVASQIRQPVQDLSQREVGRDHQVMQ